MISIKDILDNAGAAQQAGTSVVQSMIKDFRAGISAYYKNVLSADNQEPLPVETIVDAIRILGEIKAEDAASELVQYLTLEDPAQKSEDSLFDLPDYNALYPAVGALTRIGPPSTRFVLELLRKSTSDDSLIVQNAVFVLNGIYGPQAASAILDTQIAPPALESLDAESQQVKTGALEAVRQRFVD